MVIELGTRLDVITLFQLPWHERFRVGGDRRFSVGISCLEEVVSPTLCCYVYITLKLLSRSGKVIREHFFDYCRTYKLLLGVNSDIMISIMFHIFNNYNTSPSFLRADSQRGTAESTIARRKLGLVV